jgi:Na+/proline symporter
VIRPSSSDSHLVFVNRLTLVVLSLIPAYFALQKYGDVQEIIIAKAKVLGSFFFIPVLVGLNWRGGTAAGAMAAMLGGVSTCVFWELNYQQSFAATWGIDSIEVAILVSLILFVGVSKLTKPVPEENLRIFFK